MGVGFEVLADEFSLAAPFLPMSIYFLSDCVDESAEARDERLHLKRLTAARVTQPKRSLSNRGGNRLHLKKCLSGLKWELAQPLAGGKFGDSRWF